MSPPPEPAGAAGSPLLPLLAARIRAQGPLGLPEYMALCLGHPRHGYYATRDPLGRDFVTAPEISQVFGELVGLWLVERWQALGSPARFRLVELGPGRGTLMADALRAARLVPAFGEAARLHLVESSPLLRRSQEAALAPLLPAGRSARWHESIETLPEGDAKGGPLLLVANEFFDALPIRQYQRTEQGWAERQIGLAEDGRTLAWGLGPALPEAALPGLPAAEPGELAELGLAGRRLAATLARQLAGEGPGPIPKGGGWALILDYGYAPSRTGDTFQALQDGRPADPLAAPGRADLTAHVDFAALAAAAEAEGAAARGPVEQGAFLEALGLAQRIEALSRAAAREQAEALAAGARRLAAPEAMGRLFKALALGPAGAPAPPGFASA